MILLDQGLPRFSAAILRSNGHDAIHTGEIGLSRADDAVIIERGRDEDRIVVTLDADFHALMALSGASSPSVIRIRI
jgi:predicted nuclease of predicted toxin-antitoxin system